ncbi:MAG: low molecular weight protein-tyrosine-phosphatase [Solirubrobacteraceae bacterium]
MSAQPRVLFVCLGNICRSPTAEGVMRSLADAQSFELELDSAGTGGWHVGSAPDARATQAAAARGIALAGSARQVTAADFERFDLLVAMDRANARELRGLAPDAESRDKVALLRSWDPEASSPDVPDPYYDGGGGFEEVLDAVQAACYGLLAELRAR